MAACLPEASARAAPPPRAETSDANTGFSPEQSPAYDKELAASRETYMGRPFESVQEWEAALDRWTARRPVHPGAIVGIRGFAEAMRQMRALEQDEAVRNDKWKHCVVGAAIAEKTGLGTAEFAAWLKELADLTDGLPSTHFDEVDFAATMYGARQVSAGVCKDCAEVCAARWGDSEAAWIRAFQLPR